MFRVSSHPNPVLYLRGVRKEDLEGILDFMYNGEVLLENKELELFLQIAEDLQVLIKIIFIIRLKKLF